MPAALYGPEPNTLSPDTWPGRANIHTYYTRIRVKTTVGAKGDDENRAGKTGSGPERGGHRGQSRIFGITQRAHLNRNCVFVWDEHPKRSVLVRAIRPALRKCFV